MRKLRTCFVLFFCCSVVSLQAQFAISGVVLDSATREPLPKASVFCQNTTLGTLTNKDGEFSLSLKSGGYDLIFSYAGYQTQTIRVSEQNKLEVLMLKKDNSMEEVVLKSSFEVADGWEKYGDFFLKNFIGSTPNAGKCVLNNPEVLKFFFYKKTNRLKVMATDALLISNPALGYQLRYQLDSFVYYYTTSINSYRGYCLFMQMEGSDSLQQQWDRARADAYQGSKLHFLRSYYDSTLQEDGWIITLLDSTNDKKFNKISDPYDSLYYGGLDSTGEIELWYPRKISVTYTKKSPEPEYLKKMNLPKSVPYPISYIDIRETIAITENGYYYDQKDWINQGYWSWKNLADLLPYDYVPD
ncbi:MAG: carboxypeptidase-like regulatory domain-containing protein [Sphingobacteriales bacterium]|nr:carboxypeptidase-like regulatory domain-containing protein [Sphingobacteriales bacterium]